MFLLPVILAIGLSTSIIDLKTKKIYNRHLIIGAAAGLIALGHDALLGHEPVLFHLLNGLAAFIVGFVLHRTVLWRGGDAKLFTLYAFLMPLPVYHPLAFPCVISLFACSFIAGMILLIPVFIRDVIINRQVIAHDLSSPSTLEALLRGTTRLIMVSWIMFPFYYLAIITNPILILLIMYLSFSWRITKDKNVGRHYVAEFLQRNRILLPACLLLGLLMRMLLSPASLLPMGLIRFGLISLGSVLISLCIQTTFNHFKNYHERVPFAPILLMGFILSYTPFLVVLRGLLGRWNIMLYHYSP